MVSSALSREDVSRLLTKTQPANISRFITLKELAELVEQSVATCRRHEAEWGLTDCRATGAHIRYHRQAALAALRRCGLLEAETSK
jgi:hypothetical protein